MNCENVKIPKKSVATPKRAARNLPPKPKECTKREEVYAALLALLRKERAALDDAAREVGVI